VGHIAKNSLLRMRRSSVCTAAAPHTGPADSAAAAERAAHKKAPSTCGLVALYIIKHAVQSVDAVDHILNSEMHGQRIRDIARRPATFRRRGQPARRR